MIAVILDLMFGESISQIVLELTEVHTVLLIELKNNDFENSFWCHKHQNSNRGDFS